MRRACVALLTMGLLATLARGVHGQRLAPDFRSASASAAFDNAGFLRTSVRSRPQPVDCRFSPPLRLAFNGLAGAAGGWLAYEITLGIWVSGEGATPDATVRRIRRMAIASGAILGVVRGAYRSRQCRAN